MFGESDSLPRITVIEKDIKLKDDTPFRIPHYRYPAEKTKTILQQMRKMIIHGVIVAEFSPYGTPIMILWRKDGCFRFCIDFSRLNGDTIDAGQCQPVIHTILRISNAEFFSTIDLRKCYWQIPLTKWPRKLAAFTTPDRRQYIMISSKSWADHLRHIALILEKLHIYTLFCSLDKCHFGMKQIPLWSPRGTTKPNENTSGAWSKRCRHGQGKRFRH